MGRQSPPSGSPPLAAGSTSSPGSARRTEWHDVEVWGKTAEACGKHLEKGGRAYVEGRIKTENWEDKQGQKRSRVKIAAESVRFLGKPNGKSEAQPSDDSDGDAAA